MENLFLQVTQSIIVPPYGTCRLMEKYVLTVGFRRYAMAKEIVNATDTLDVLCDGTVVTIQFGQIVLMPMMPTKEV